MLGRAPSVPWEGTDMSFQLQHKELCQIPFKLLRQQSGSRNWNITVPWGRCKWYRAIVICIVWAGKHKCSCSSTSHLHRGDFQLKICSSVLWDQTSVFACHLGELFALLSGMGRGDKKLLCYREDRLIPSNPPTASTLLTSSVTRRSL